MPVTPERAGVVDEADCGTSGGISIALFRRSRNVEEVASNRRERCSERYVRANQLLRSNGPQPPRAELKAPHALPVAAEPSVKPLVR
jgi:hypothetical protein